ncbi:MAG TPA: di-heme-cytochrome C peroxidase [Rhodocyclaceae bacterium]|nr:di-heme-cytochrome C peroxidase [Rhodocyclaceae bacterium]
MMKSLCSCLHVRRKTLFLWFLGLIVLMVIVGAISRIYQFWDKDPDRGATVVKQDIFGDSFTKVKYLEQGWQPSESLWFYTTTQGSDLLPYDFFLVLEQAGKREPFRSDDNINAYRYLPQKATFSNPDALPVGFVKDTYKGKQYVGLTCAACHTGQLNYKGTGMRIDGGPAGADMTGFITGLSKALYTAQEDPEVRKRFVQNVLALGNFKDEKAVLDDLKKYSQRINTYSVINRSPTEYGYARLDAFGRIYNRVLEHAMSARQLRTILQDTFTPEELESVMKDAENVLSSNQRDHIVDRISELLTVKQQLRLRNQIFNPPDAPVSYPFLWDIPQHDYVQWNGLASNGGLGPVGRNTGEVIGVFGTLDWREEPGFSLSSLIGGWGLSKTHINFESSVNVRNLRRIEQQLSSLHSPDWPEDVLPPIDKERRLRGRHLFTTYCASCHSEIQRDDPDRRIVASMSRVSSVGTDPKMASNGAKYVGWSGITRNQYVSTDVGNVLIDQRAPAAVILTKATLNVVATPDPDKFFLQRWYEWAYDLVFAFFNNEIQPSMKGGGYDPDTTASPFASIMAYKARSLNGIWATGPYLHNGSVPTLYDLLLPKRRPGDPANGEYRPDKFQVGAREFDPVKVGPVSTGYKGFTYDTAVKGNSNAGHEYAAGRTPQPNGETPPPMTKEQRLDLVEYLKSL